MKMKAYSVTIQATLSVVSGTKVGAVNIAKRAVAACPDLMSCYYIGEGYFSFDNLEEEVVKVPEKLPQKQKADFSAFPLPKSQGPSADDEEVPF